MNCARIAGLVVLASAALATASRAQHPSKQDSTAIAGFNTALAAATRAMDNASTLALWDDDGVSLTPGSPPLVGKAAIRAFFDGVIKQIAGATMQRFDMRCYDVLVAAPIATEWCVEHQVVLLSDKTTFDGWGKLGLVLRRGTDGKWRLKQETWLPGLPSDSTLLRPVRH